MSLPQHGHPGQRLYEKAARRWAWLRVQSGRKGGRDFLGLFVPPSSIFSLAGPGGGGFGGYCARCRQVLRQSDSAEVFNAKAQKRREFTERLWPPRNAPVAREVRPEPIFQVGDSHLRVQESFRSIGILNSETGRRPFP